MRLRQTKKTGGAWGRKGTLLRLNAALIGISLPLSGLADDANGDRPGLNQPPGLSVRMPVTIPETGNSGLLLATALFGLSGGWLLSARHGRSLC